MQDSKKRINTAYCSKVARFPKEAYLNYVFYAKDEDIVMLYPFEVVYPSITTLQNSMKKYAFDWNKEIANGMEIIDVSIIVPITLETLYPLRKEFWDNPTYHFDDLDRFRGFWRAAAKPSFYKVIVTPQWIGTRVSFQAIIPFYITATRKDIDTFMLYSDYPVDEAAKYAAIYTIGTPLRFNWRTGDVSTVRHFEKTPILH